MITCHLDMNRVLDEDHARIAEHSQELSSSQGIGVDVIKALPLGEPPEFKLHQCKVNCGRFI